MKTIVFIAGLLFATGCSNDPGGAAANGCPDPGLVDTPLPVTEFVAVADDFGCFLEEAQVDVAPEEKWYNVRRFYIKNLAGRTQEALDVACGRKPTPYPVGTFVQLIAFEAMVKRGGDFSPESNSWEFFSLEPSETTDGYTTLVLNRGNTETTNFLGANCFECHRKALPDRDLFCEGDSGCDPLPVDDELITSFQQGDSRCQVHLEGATE